MTSLSPEDPPHDLQALVLLVPAEQELGRLRQGEQGDADDGAGGGADHGEHSPAGPLQLVGDDGPGHASHSDVTDHPEGGEDTEGSASLAAGLELGKIGPDERNTAAYSGDERNELLLSIPPLTPVH